LLLRRSSDVEPEFDDIAIESTSDNISWVSSRPMPLRYVDPAKKRGAMYKLNVRFGRSRAGQFIARHIARHTDPHLFRLTGGRVNMGAIINAPLVSTGAKSGQRREVQLTYFHDGPDVILLASNYGGTKHPQWFYNLKAHPDCDFGGETFSAAQVTDSDECTRLYGLAERVYAGYSDYSVKTAPVGRQIPIFRLKPR
jgi:deazaflavin-dependent oxidoreductase (nitroreductase family)